MPDGLRQDNEDAHDALVRVAKDELMKAFAGSKTWECERWLGSGSYGMTVLLRNKDPLHFHKQKRMVLKRAIGQRRNYQDFRTEIYMLKRMRGNAHHGQIIAGTEETGLHRVGHRTVFGRTLRRIRTLFNNPPKEIFGILSTSYGPAILLEYIENGTLLQVQNRAYERNIDIPNRILWSFYLCLVRACIGLAYPTAGSAQGPPVLETISNLKQPLPLVHNDIAGRNIMVDRHDVQVPEHKSVPALKLIDFGISRRARAPTAAIRYNLYQATTEMLWLITKNTVDLKPVVFNGIETVASDILPRDGRDEYPNLDPELRGLIVDALRSNLHDRPLLAEMLDRTSRGAAKGPADYPNRILEEGDDAVGLKLQQLVYDA